MLKAQCYRLAPLLFGGNHILVIFSQNIYIRNSFFRAQNAKFSLPWETLPRSVALLPSSSPRRLLSETVKYKSFPEALACFARSLIIN